MATDWKSEAEIKEELRILTGELRKLREELRGFAAQDDGALGRAGRRRPPPRGRNGPNHNLDR